MRVIIDTDTKKMVLKNQEMHQILYNYNENPFRFFNFFNKWLDLLKIIRNNEAQSEARKIHVWHIAAPKSGSTWLTTILIDLLHWNVCPLIPHYHRREQEIEIGNLMYAAMQEFCFSPHQHCRFSDSTRCIIENLEIIPILQHRSIFDTVVSFFDHCNDGRLAFPMAYMDKHNWEDLDSSRRMDFVIDLVVPWYFNFYAGWFTSDLFKEGKILMVSYEDLVADPHTQVRRVVDRIGIEKTRDEIDHSIQAAGGKFTRKTAGITGRGAQLSDEQKQRIRNMAGYYPHIDFTILGL